MATHAAVPARHHGHASWAVPATLGVSFGIYAMVLKRFEEGGFFNGAQLLLGVVCAVVMGGLTYGLGRIQGGLRREVRAVAYGALTAVAVGFLTSLSDGSVLRSACIGVAVGAGAGLMTFYALYVHQT
ncbi:hypothetical protein ABZ208_07505 [Streptomyces sp. NPDC006208]|uniref:hypothetical protein n=1 Tax=Streptomyces sp. NPDC006208 TaxID=3156734 RepID=UPI0033B96581